MANLQSQVESLTTTNALMKEDLEIARANTMALMQENAILKAQKNHKQNLRARQQVIRVQILVFLVPPFF